MTEEFWKEMDRQREDWITAYLLSKQPGEEAFIPFYLHDAFPLRGYTPKVNYAVYHAGLKLWLTDE